VVELAAPPPCTFASLDIDRVAAIAHGVATRLGGRPSPDDAHADLRSDLMLAALERWPKFNASRGRSMAFLAVAMTRAGTSILRAQHAAKRGGRSTTVSLGDPIGNVQERHPSLVTANPLKRRDLELDVRAAIDALPDDLATVCNDFLDAATDGRRRPVLSDAAAAALRDHFGTCGLSEYLS